MMLGLDEVDDEFVITSNGENPLHEDTNMCA